MEMMFVYVLNNIEKWTNLQNINLKLCNVFTIFK